MRAEGTDRSSQASQQRTGGTALTSRSQIPALKVMMGSIDMMDGRER